MMIPTKDLPKWFAIIPLIGMIAVVFFGILEIRWYIVVDTEISYPIKDSDSLAIVTFSCDDADSVYAREAVENRSKLWLLRNKPYVVDSAIGEGFTLSHAYTLQWFVKRE